MTVCDFNNIDSAFRGGEARAMEIPALLFFVTSAAVCACSRGRAADSPSGGKLPEGWRRPAVSVFRLFRHASLSGSSMMRAGAPHAARLFLPPLPPPLNAVTV